MLNLNFLKKERKVYFRNKNYVVRIDLVEKSNLIYLKKPIISKKSNLKMKENLENEHFDIFSEDGKKQKFPVIKLSKKNTEENGLNYALKIAETDENIRFCILTYHNCKIINEYDEEETTITFYLDQKVIEKENIKFKLPIGKDFTYLELKGEKGLMVI